MTITHPVIMWLGALFPLAANLAFLVTGYFLYRAEKQLHSCFILIGAAITSLLAIWNIIIWAPGVGLYYVDEDFDGSELFDHQFVVEFGLNVLGNGLFAWGLVTYAWVQYRKSRMPRIGE